MMQTVDEPMRRSDGRMQNRSSRASSWIPNIMIALGVGILTSLIIWYFSQINKPKSKPVKKLDGERVVGKSSAELNVNASNDLDQKSILSDALNDDTITLKTESNDNQNDNDATRRIGRITVDTRLKQPYTTYVDWVEYRGPPLQSKAVIEEMDVRVASNQSVEDAITNALIDRELKIAEKRSQDKEDARGPCPVGYRFLPPVDKNGPGQCVKNAPDGYELVLWQPPGESSTLWYHRALCPKGSEKNRDECKRRTMNSQVYYEDTWKANYYCDKSRPFVGGICRESKDKPGIIYPVNRCPNGFYATGMYCAKCTQPDFVLKGGGDQRPYCASKCPLGSDDRNDPSGATCWKKYTLAPIEPASS